MPVNRIDIVAYRGDKQKLLTRIQRPLKSLNKPSIEITDLRRNPNKRVLYENKSPMFFQVYYYKNRPYTLAIVCGNRLIAFPFDYAFVLNDALNKYIEEMKDGFSSIPEA